MGGVFPCFTNSHGLLWVPGGPAAGQHDNWQIRFVRRNLFAICQPGWETLSRRIALPGSRILPTHKRIPSLGACVDPELTARCSRSPGDVAFSKTTNFLPCFPGKERPPLSGAPNAGSFPSRLGQPGVQAWPLLKNSKCPASRQTQTAVYASRWQIPEPAAALFLLKSH